MEKYNYQPLSLQTFSASSECIDFLLTKPSTQLTDFLFSPHNTHLADHGDINMFNATFGQESLGPRQDFSRTNNRRCLKLKMCFID